MKIFNQILGSIWMLMAVIAFVMDKIDWAIYCLLFCLIFAVNTVRDEIREEREQ